MMLASVKAPNKFKVYLLIQRPYKQERSQKRGLWGIASYNHIPLHGIHCSESVSDTLKIIRFSYGDLNDTE